MAENYLDKAGATYLVGKIKALNNTKQDALASQTAYSNKGSATKVPKITTNALGQVTSITEVTITQPTVTSTYSATSTDAMNGVAVASAISDALSSITGIKFEVVSSLPSTGVAGTIYLKAKTTSLAGDIYDEYVWITDKFELIGTTAPDLTGYLKDTDLVAITNGEIDAMFT